MGTVRRVVICTLVVLALLSVLAAVILIYGTDQRERKPKAEKTVSGETALEETASWIAMDEANAGSSIALSEAETGADTALDEADTQADVFYGETGTESDFAPDATDTQNSGMTEAEPGAATTIVLTGDVLFDKAFRAGYDAAGIAGVLAEDVRQPLYDADILMINHEFPFSDRGTPMEDKQFTFRCSPSYVTALTEMGVDIASLANNHTLDFGKDALRDTFETLDGAGILYAGAGDTVERAEQVQVIEANGMRFGFLAVTRVVPTVDWKVEVETPGLFSCYDDTRLVELVREAKATCDFLIVFVHWGIERQETPEEYQTSIAKKCIAAGADAIVGAHSHCLQSIDFIEGKPVFYSLGNFIFGYTIERSAYLEITVDAAGTPVYRLIPVYASGGITKLAEGGEREATIRKLNEIALSAFVAEDGYVTEK